jgi:glycine/D-amino acid oxidase-like deaminating enzyme
MAVRPHVLIVGAGIVGASIAWHLARAGARVTVTDAGAPGGVATRHSWAWINASWGNPEPYFRLRVRSMQEWRSVGQEVPGIAVAWVGSLYWALPPDQLDAFAARHAAWGYDIRRVTRAEVQRLEPQLATPPAFALHAPAEGVVEPLAAANALLAAAEYLGTVVIGHNPVRALTLSGGKVTGVETANGRMDADEVVLAAGVGTASLAATAGLRVPMRAAPGLVVATRPHARCLNGLLISPAVELRQTAAGRLLAIGDVDDAEAGGDGGAAALLDTVRGMIASGASLSAEYHAVAHRPMPLDGFPIVGRADGIGGLYTAVTHSGITLAPAIGRFVADEILAGRRDELLAPYGVERFLRTPPA